MILGLFFTRNVSLEVWVESGLIDREKAIYEYHLNQGFLEKVYWFTYGHNDKKYYDDLVSSGRLDPRIIVISPSKLIPGIICKYCYAWCLPFLNRKVYTQVDIVKSNQCPGAAVAWLVGRLYKKPFYFRTGYTESSIYPELHDGKRDIKYRRLKRIENFLYDKCDIASVSSEHDKQYVCQSYGIAGSKVRLVRNFIDTEVFKKETGLRNRCNKIVYVGRLSNPKNLFNILHAVAKIGMALDCYGRGEQKNELEKLAQRLRADVTFKGVIANKEIPKVLNQYKYYILASTYEGMPKTLLEAMACGCICIGTPVGGIAEVIEDGVNGFLSKSVDADDIANAIQRASVSEKKDTISENACSLIRLTYSLTEIAKIDKWSIEDICN